MKAVTYRYSAAENPTWLDQQEAECRRYADEHGLTVAEAFTDVGHSRHGLRHMLDAARREEVTGLIVTDLARLGTKYADHVAVVQQLHDAGVDIHVTKDRTTGSVEEYLIAVKQAHLDAEARRSFPSGGSDSTD